MGLAKAENGSLRKEKREQAPALYMHFYTGFSVPRNKEIVKEKLKVRQTSIECARAKVEKRLTSGTGKGLARYVLSTMQSGVSAGVYALRRLRRGFGA